MVASLGNLKTLLSMVITETGLGMIWAFAEIAETVKTAIKKRCNIV